MNNQDEFIPKICLVFVLPLVTLSPMKLLERFIHVAARRRLARSTRECYWNWIVEFLRFHCSGGVWRRPAELNETHVEAFLNHLALQKRVSASTQNQALCALVFLYKQVGGG